MKYYSYTCIMKSTVEVIVTTFTLVFGMSLFSWVLHYSPSMNDGVTIEAVIEKEEEE
jgi:hypothetical protein